MKKLILLTLHLLVVFSSFSQSAFDKALSEISSDLADKLALKGKKKTVVLYITDFNKTTSVTGKYLADIISSNIVNNPGDFMVFDRDNLGGIAEINTLISEGYLTEDKTQKIGKILSVESIIVGTYTILGNSIKLSVKALDVTTAFVIVSSLKDLPFDSDAGSLLGINVSSSNGSIFNSQNRGFNNVPLNSNENYNNPETVNKECESKDYGDYCFKNNSALKLRVWLYKDIDDYYSGVELILMSGQSKCFYNLKAYNYNFTISKNKVLSDGQEYFPDQLGYVREKGQILVERCKSKSFVIR